MIARGYTIPKRWCIAMAREQKSINIEVGGRIKACRKEKGLSREELACHSGYSPNFVQEVERGRSGLSSESMRAFSKALQVSADYLLFGLEVDEFCFIADMLKAVPVEKRKRVLHIIEEVVKCTQ